ncbi:MAG: GAF and ANTAR domain-containing protein [Nocardioidaceae bacterium]
MSDARDDQTRSDQSRAVVDAVADVVAKLDSDWDLEHALMVTVRAAVETIPAADHAGVTVLREGQPPDSPAVTDPLVAHAASLQDHHREGPCVDAIRYDQTVRVPDLAAETRWPAFTAAVAQLPVRSVLSFRLFATSTAAGALNLYAAAPEAFDQDSEQIGSMFAANASIALAAAYRHEHLARAVATRDVIGQAKGILMERQTLTGEQAFALLVAASQRANIKLHDIAAQLVHAAETAAIAGGPATENPQGDEDGPGAT